MLFNSFDFLIFFPIVCILYFLIPYKYRNLLLLISSYFFYMNWKPIYALLILISTITTYFCGIGLSQENNRLQKNKAKLILAVCIVINLGILFFYKYFNFFNECVFDLLSILHIRWYVPNLDILLPVGISFYTFQAIGYIIDIYRKNFDVERNFCTYALFISFFPQLVAGPIERATHMMPQFYEKHTFTYDNAVKGIKLMLWGYFMKLCVADRLSQYVDSVYNNLEFHTGTSMTLATLFFAFQIYCDFAGYSLIAVGSAKIMGFRLSYNFNRPYFSTSIQDFWRRWHITLGAWLKDYIYIPLGGSRVGLYKHLRNLFITFLISGIWHGASWNFVIWGGIHGIYLMIAVLKNKYLPSIKANRALVWSVNIVISFCLANFAWIFFRANDVRDAFYIIRQSISNPGALYIDKWCMMMGSISLLILITKEVAEEFNCIPDIFRKKTVKYALWILLAGYILLTGVFDNENFIYFQF